MKHKHYDMIVAKAANMDLIQIYKAGGVWQETSEQFNMNNGWAFFEDSDYFLCLPQHKEACLHWLNGGELLINRKAFNSDGDEVPSCGFLNWDRPSREWRPEVSFMTHNCNFKIKPKKEKRWIAITPDGHATDKHFKDKDDCVDYVCKDYLPSFVGVAQYIEIEVEV